ncbi:MAG: L-2-hydroxyglutarate oxidase [Acidimicrobiia bacterium]
MLSRPGGQNLAVIGGGILGVAIARRLADLDHGSKVTILEKESRLASHQTGRNSGVVHAGIYYAPGSLKARLCSRGRHLMREFCDERGLLYERCGKLIVARDDSERARLDDLFHRANTNGVPGVRMVDGAEIPEIEPHVVGVAAIHSPETAIVDFRSITEALADDVRARPGEILLDHEVIGVGYYDGGVLLRGRDFELAFDRVVICAGLHADRLAVQAGAGADPKIVPFRGEYFLLRPERRFLVRGLVYPVPDPRYPFLGVHLTKRFDGEILVGPNAVLALAREGYRWGDISWSDTFEVLRWPGFWSLARKHWRTGASELMRSGSKRAFARLARAYVPDVSAGDLVSGPSGVRAQALGADGRLLDDFSISREGPVVVLRNAPSPGATSSLAIAEYVVENYL